MKKHLLFLGPPGAGKGTQASFVSNSFSYLHLSTGELLRNEVKLKTNLGIKVEEVINSGKLVNDELVLEIVRKNLFTQHKGWILDGYPRNLSQANALNKVLDTIDQSLDMVINFIIAEDVLVERLLNRGRSDDNEDAIRTRLKIYKETTYPLISFYENQKILINIDGDRDLKIISEEISQKMA